MTRIVLKFILVAALILGLFKNVVALDAHNFKVFGAGFDQNGELVPNLSDPLMGTDGDFSTAFMTGEGVVRGFMGINLIHKHPINKITIHEQFDTIKQYSLEWSNTGNDWHEILTSTQRIGAEGRSFSFPRVDGRYFRIKIEKVDINPEKSSSFEITEFKANFDTSKNITEINAALERANEFLEINGSDGFIYNTGLIEKLLENMDKLEKGKVNPLLVQYQIDGLIDKVNSVLDEIYAAAIVPEEAFLAVQLNMNNLLVGNRATFNSSAATTLESSMRKDGNSTLWDSIGSAQDARLANASDKITTNYTNIKNMALAYSVPASSRYKDAKLLNSIKYALSIGHQYWYGADIEPYGNWWAFNIGIPIQLTETMIMIWDDLIEDEKAIYLTDLEAFVPADYQNTWTGANRIHVAICDNRMGILSKNLQKAERAQRAIKYEIAYKDGNNLNSTDGFYTDGSFIQHSYIAYNGSYGGTMMDYIVRYIQEMQGSPWEITASQVEIIYDWYENGFIPLIRSLALMDMVNGRAIVRKNNDKSLGYSILSSMVRFANTLKNETKKTKLLSVAKRWALDDTFFNWSSKPNAEIKAVLNNVQIPVAERYTGNKAYNNMDRAVHHRDNYAFGVSMFSSRIKAFEQTNGENLKGWYTGSGMTYLYNADDSQYTDDYWWTVDMYSLPGTTLTTAPRSTQRWQGEFLSEHDFAGALSYADQYGIAAMELQQWKSDLSARKSWFMFDDEIVCVGTNITAINDKNNVQTIVENRRIEKNQGENEFRINNVVQPPNLGWSISAKNVSTAFLKGTAANGADIGYYFPTPVTISAKREHIEKLPSDVSSGNSQTTPAFNNFLSMRIDHGVNPIKAGYSYVLLPDKSAAQTREYANNPDIEILSQTDSVHAVRDNTLGLTGIVSFEDKYVSVSGIEIDKAVLLMIKDDGSFSIADPSRKQGYVMVTLDKEVDLRSDNPRITITKQSGKTNVKINLSGMSGKIMQVDIK